MTCPEPEHVRADPERAGKPAPREAEESLRERESELDAIVSMSPDGIVTISADGKVHSANPAFEQITGLSAGSVVGMGEWEFDALVRGLCGLERSCDALFDCVARQMQIPSGAGDSACARQCPLGRIRLSGRTQVRRRRQSDCGVPVTLLQSRDTVLKIAVRDLSGLSIRRVVYFWDISLEAELQRIKSEFLSAAAHELRTPMASVFGFSELLLARDYDRATYLDVVRTIHDQSARLIHLLNDLLDLARIEARAGKAFNVELQPVRPVVESAVAELMVPGDGRRVEVDIEDGLPRLPIDDEKIKRALTNVLSNAYKYSPGGGPIGLKVFRDPADGSGRVGIAVTDHGIGMSPGEVSHVGERFWRADKARHTPGSGLGMSLVQEILDFHRGSMEIHSQAGKGTEVTLWLPCDPPELQASP